MHMEGHTSGVVVVDVLRVCVCIVEELHHLLCSRLGDIGLTRVYYVEGYGHDGVK